MILDAASPLYAVVTQDPYGQGFNAMTALIKAIKGEDISDTKGKVQFVPGTVLSKGDLEGVNKWRADNGL
jgi:ABC-type sugar transport system substrate-binding protein